MVDSHNYSLYSDFEYVARKSKGRRKSKPKVNSRVVGDENTDCSESSEPNTQADEGLDKMIANEIEGVPLEDAAEEYWDSNLESTDKVSPDAFLSKKASYQNPEIGLQSKKEFEHRCDSLVDVNTNESVEKSLEVEQEENKEEEIINVRALSKHDSTYKLESFEKNVLLIFNQENIEGYKPRLGTNKDVDALRQTFEQFGFEVTEHKDLTKKEIIDTMDTFCAQDFTEYGCVAIAVLTHGMENGLLRAKDQPYSEIEIINYFKVHDKPTLITKPKFLIIQACRGPLVIPGVRAFSLPSKIQADLDASTEPYILPAEADILILHSSFYRTPSYRHADEGSWFIQTLCNKISSLASTHDITSIFLEVTRDVALEKELEVYNRRTLQMQVNKQIPVMTTTLIRKLYFRRFGDPGEVESANVGCTAAIEASPSSTTPMLVQLGPCFCFLEQFDYMRNCFRHYVEENPDDKIAHSFLDLADTYEDHDIFNAAKNKLTKTMTDYLTDNAKHCYFYKYLFMKRA